MRFSLGLTKPLTGCYRRGVGDDQIGAIVTKPRVRRRVSIEIEVPEELRDLEVPPNFTLDEFIEFESERIQRMYPADAIKNDGIAEVGPDLREMMRAADRWAKFFELKRQLVRLQVRQEMGNAKKAAGDGEVFAERRKFPVKSHDVAAYEVDAIYAVTS
jgi:hypothetical protein